MGRELNRLCVGADRGAGRCPDKAEELRQETIHDATLYLGDSRIVVGHELEVQRQRLLPER